MATKKFNQMTTKKLNARLNTASDEDKVAIEAVLAAREQAKGVVADTQDEAPAADTQDEAAADTQDEAPAAPEVKHSEKMTDEERHALAESLKVNINHRCQVVPFNTIEWVDGYIAGVVEEKRSSKVLYAIKIDDGRRIVKVHDSNLLKILDETVELKRKVRARRSGDAEKIEWTPEMIAAEVNAVIGNVGKQVEVEKYSTVDENGNTHIESVSGRIMAIVPDKRSQRVFYRISIPTPTEENPSASKITHKLVTSENIHIADDFDAEGKEFNAKYCERREAAAARTPRTPQDRVICCEENLKKAEEKLQKATAELELKKQQLEEAKAELNAYLAAQAGEPAADTQDNASAAEEVDPLA